MEISKKIQSLRTKINKANDLYYRHSASPMEDQEYDSLYKELEELERRHPEYLDPDSPTQRVGNDLSPGFEKVLHEEPMLSIANSYSKEDLGEFHRQVTDKIDEKELEYVVELKIDGAALSLIYDGPRFVRAVTRGDGTKGDDVTANAKTIRGIPMHVEGPVPTGRWEVRGEVYMTLTHFKDLYEYHRNVFGKELQNPRNTASGSLKLKNPRESARRQLQFFAYNLFGAKELHSHWEKLEQLKTWKFDVNPHRKKLRGLDKLLTYCDSWDEKRHTLDYNIDGLVIKVNNEIHQRRLGFTAKSPRWAMAYKFKAEAVESQVLSISTQVGRTGAVTPVANLKPIDLAGTVVKRATLHNFDEIERLQLQINDYVMVEKGGEIIPKITVVLLDKRPSTAKVIIPPSHCPDCHSLLVKEEGEVALRCDNLQCPAQLQRAIQHFVSRPALDIEHVGPALIQQLLEANMVKDVADLYTLTKDKLLELERMAEKSAQNVIESIEASKGQSLEKLLMGLGIRFIGKTAAKTLARHFKNLKTLEQATPEELSNINEIGERMAESVAAYFSNPSNRALIEKLVRAGVSVEYTGSVKEVTAIAGKTFVLTGTLPSLTRDEASALIESAGGKVSSSISKKTSFLLAGEAAGSKLAKAQKLGVSIISESGLKELLKGS